MHNTDLDVEIKQLYRDGRSVSEIAEALKCSRSQVFEWMATNVPCPFDEWPSEAQARLLAAVRGQ